MPLGGQAAAVPATAVKAVGRSVGRCLRAAKMALAGMLCGIGRAWSLGGCPGAGRVLASSSIPLLSNTCRSFGYSTRWEKKNNITYPPQGPDEPRRPAEIYHSRRDIKYNKDKMWYLAKLIRGMGIDEALAQMEFNDKKGAKIIKEVLLEAQELAVTKYNVEFKSNLYIAESFSGKGHYLKRIRYHGKGCFGVMDKVKCHYFVRLVEGPPPPPAPVKTGFDQAKEYVEELRKRTIINTL